MEQGEAALADGRAEPFVQFGAALQVGAHGRGVEHHPALALGLGAVHREVGVAHQLVGGGARVGGRTAFRGAEGDPDAGGDAEFAAADPVGLGERGAQPFGELLDLEPAERAADQGGELVAAEPGDGVPAADGALEPAGGLDQQLVADLVAGGVVDRLEAVQVEEEHGDPGARLVLRASGCQGGPQPLGEQRPVGQVGERIVERVVLQLGLQHDPFGDVAAVQDQAVAVPVDRRLDVQPLAAAGADPAPVSYTHL